MVFELPPLPYSKDALAPHISKETLEFHYGKHHAGYVNKLNGLVKDSPLASKTLEELIKTQTGPIYNNAAQIWNHTFYWKSMSPNGGGAPTGQIKDRIEKDFGGFESFKKEFSDVASGHFGSGWAWLVHDPKNNKLRVEGSHDAGNPLRDGLVPILTCDVWEHAFYIDYRNDKASYVAGICNRELIDMPAWWNTVNWEFANENLKSL